VYIYNSILQGFEVVVSGRKYFAFSKFDIQGMFALSFCGTTFPGWSHDMNSKDWACYIGRKTTEVPPKKLFPDKPR